jgi:GTP-binding protein
MESNCPFVVVANKLDKLGKTQIEPNLRVIREDLSLPDDCVIVPFSAEKGTGREELVRIILEAVNE